MVLDPQIIAAGILAGAIIWHGIAVQRAAGIQARSRLISAGIGAVSALAARALARKRK